jgi:hypothetical protein
LDSLPKKRYYLKRKVILHTWTILFMVCMKIAIARHCYRIRLTGRAIGEGDEFIEAKAL